MMTDNMDLRPTRDEILYADMRAQAVREMREYVQDADPDKIPSPLHEAASESYMFFLMRNDIGWDDFIADHWEPEEQDIIEWVQERDRD